MNGLIFNIARWRFELKRYYGPRGSRGKPEQLYCTVTSASLLSVILFALQQLSFHRTLLLFLRRYPEGIYFTSYFFLLRICLCVFSKDNAARNYRSRGISGRRNLQSLSNRRPIMFVGLRAAFREPRV